MNHHALGREQRHTHLVQYIHIPTIPREIDDHPQSLVDNVSHKHNLRSARRRNHRWCMHIFWVFLDARMNCQFSSGRLRSVDGSGVCNNPSRQTACRSHLQSMEYDLFQDALCWFDHQSLLACPDSTIDANAFDTCLFRLQSYCNHQTCTLQKVELLLSSCLALRPMDLHIWRIDGNACNNTHRPSAGAHIRRLRIVSFQTSAYSFSASKGHFGITNHGIFGSPGIGGGNGRLGSENGMWIPNSGIEKHGSFGSPGMGGGNGSDGSENGNAKLKPNSGKSTLKNGSLGRPGIGGGIGRVGHLKPGHPKLHRLIHTTNPGDGGIAGPPANGTPAVALVLSTPT